MRDDPSFIRTISASPDDDAPRLVYSDYLEETEIPANLARAEFIRVQIEKATLVPLTPRWNQLWWRDTELLDWARTWRAELPAMDGVQYGGFLRGFIDSVGILAISFARESSLLFDSIPVRKLTINDLNEETAREIVGLDELAQVSELMLAGSDPHFLPVFADRGPWPRLKSIRFAIQEPAGSPD